MIPYFEIKSQIEKMTPTTIKSIIKRQRLCFSKKQITFYLYTILKHGKKQRDFLSIYNSIKKKTILRLKLPHYSAFMDNIATVAPLMKMLFVIWNHKAKIVASSLWNAVDTTLIVEKEEKSINEKDWKQNRVTTRTVNKNKVRICGSKGLVFINRNGFVTHAERCRINASDVNFLKDSEFYRRFSKGFLLADRGFQSKIVRARMTSIENCKFISPYQKKQKKDLPLKERKMYKRRWKIETLFQKIKNTYGEVRLNLKGKYRSVIKDAKFFSTIWTYNHTLSTKGV